MENVKVTENEKTEKNVGLTTLSTALIQRQKNVDFFTCTKLEQQNTNGKIN